MVVGPIRPRHAVGSDVSKASPDTRRRRRGAPDIGKHVERAYAEESRERATGLQNSRNESGLAPHHGGESRPAIVRPLVLAICALIVGVVALIALLPGGGSGSSQAPAATARVSSAARAVPDGEADASAAPTGMVVDPPATTATPVALPVAAADDCGVGLPTPLDPASIGTSTEVLGDDFAGAPIGPLEEDYLKARWNAPAWTNGIDEGRVVIVDRGSSGDKALMVLYPDGGFGAGSSGAQWPTSLPTSQAMYLTYYVRFADDFEFVRGGKLPGLAGGEANTGGDRPDGTDGWSARMMWREGGCAEFYTYHPDQPYDTGESFRWAARIEPGTWHRIEQVVVMNTPRERDGMLLGWFDGRLVADYRNIRFRDVEDLAIDTLYFSTFFGGGDDEWAPSTDQSIEFDDFSVRLFDAAEARW